jgi:hypothetical protein
MTKPRPAEIIRQFFSNEKNFGQPVIGDAGLNRRGFHVARILLSDAAHLLRTLPFWWLHPVLWYRFNRDGMVVIENFLPQEEFAALMREYEATVAEHARNHPLPADSSTGFGRKRENPGGFDRNDGCSWNRFISLRPEHAALCRLYAGSWRMSLLVLALFGMVNRVKKHDIYLLIHGDDASNPDDQRDWHRDTFHHTYKIWYYVDAVGEEDGPTEFLLGSNRSTLNRLRWEYGVSVARSQPDAPEKGGALRVVDRDLPLVADGEPVRKVVVPANTLVLLDTKAFHRRGEAPGGSVRRGLYANFRPQAFWPWAH